MDNFNAFDYLILCIVPTLTIFGLIYANVYWLRILFRGRKVISRVVDVESTLTRSLQRRFLFHVSYNIDGVESSSAVDGYRTPIALKLGDKVDILLVPRNEGRMKAICLNGKVLKILFESITILLIGVGGIFCLVLLNVVSFEIRFLEVSAIGFALLDFVGTLQVAVYLIQLRENTSRTIGELIGYEETYDVDGIKGYLPIVDFEVEGTKIRFTSTMFSPERGRGVGSKVSVIFWDQFPRFAEVDAFVTVWGGFFFWLILWVASGVSLFFIA